MKANSDNNPGKFTESKGKLFFNFNIVESEKTDEHGTRTVFDYDYVEVKDKASGEIIRAIMRDKYTIEDEIALINNKFRGEVKDITEYDDYQAVRVTVKDITEEPVKPVVEKPVEETK